MSEHAVQRAASHACRQHQEPSRASGLGSVVFVGRDKFTGQEVRKDKNQQLIQTGKQIQRSQAGKQVGEENMTTWQTSRKKTRIREDGSKGDTRIRVQEQEEREDTLVRTQEADEDRVFQMDLRR